MLLIVFISEEVYLGHGINFVTVIVVDNSIGSIG